MASATASFQAARASAVATAARLRQAFDARARRERLMLIAAGVACVWMLADTLWVAPALKEWAAATTRHAAADAAMLRVNAEIEQRGAEARGHEQQIRRDLLAWRDRVGQGDAALRSFGTSLVSAPEMVPMLDGLLAQVGGLRVRSMQSLARVEVGAAAAAASPASAPAAGTALAANGTLYRQGVELTVEGSYADVLAYVRAIEAMPQHVLWGGLKLKVERHPKVVATLRLYTLSPDRSWLEI